MELGQEIIIGSIYTGDKIHGLYGGQRGTKISTPKATQVVLLFAKRRGRHDAAEADGSASLSHPEEGWHSDGFYHFRGEQQMQFVRGNRAVRDHARDGKLLLLFEGTGSVGEGANERLWRFIGPMECAGCYFTPARSGGATIMFRLVPLCSRSGSGPVLPRGLHPSDQPGVLGSALAFLARRRDAISAGARWTGPAHHRTASEWSAKCARIKSYVRERALGFCEACGRPAPFTDPEGEPYLEAHYLLRPYDSGVDPVHHVAACCPECHRRIHCGMGGRNQDATLARKIASLERAIDRRELLTVTAGVIQDAAGKVLLTQRRDGDLTGKWEFPGGKVEPGETLEVCLTREIWEELNLKIRDVQPLAFSYYQYDNFAVRLFGLSARAIGNRLELRQHSDMVWVCPNELVSYDLAPADVPIAVRAAMVIG